MSRQDWTIKKFDATQDWDEESPSESLTPQERLNQTWPLIRAMWKIRYGIDPNEQKLPRSEWPIEIRDLTK